MPESKNSSELRKLPGYKRRATERRGGGKKARLEQQQSQEAAGLGGAGGGQEEASYYSTVLDPADHSASFSPYEVSPVGLPLPSALSQGLPMIQCSGSKYLTPRLHLHGDIFFRKQKGEDDFVELGDILPLLRRKCCKNPAISHVSL